MAVSELFGLDFCVDMPPPFSNGMFRLNCSMLSSGCILKINRKHFFLFKTIGCFC